MLIMQIKQNVVSQPRFNLYTSSYQQICFYVPKDLLEEGMIFDKQKKTKGKNKTGCKCKKWESKNQAIFQILFD